MTAKSTDYDNNLWPGADMVGGGGLRGTPVVPLPSPVPPSPLEPSAVQGVGSPSGGRVHRGGDLPLSSSTPVDSAPSPGNFHPPPGYSNSPIGISSVPSQDISPGNPTLLTPGKPSLPPTVNPLPGCSEPDFCVGGLNHLCFKAPGGIDPTRDQIVWVTRR